MDRQAINSHALLSTFSLGFGLYLASGKTSIYFWANSSYNCYNRSGTLKSSSYPTLPLNEFSFVTAPKYLGALKHMNFHFLACECPCTQTVNSTVAVGRDKALLSWSEPRPRCPTTPSPANPNRTEAFFPPGYYTLFYNYTFIGKHEIFGIQCRVEIIVSGMSGLPF